MATPLKIVFMGSPGFACPAFEALLASQHKIVATFSQPPRKSGRGMKLQKTAVHQLAEQNNVPVFTPEKLGQDEVSALKELAPDFIIVAAYGLLLPQSVLDVAPCLNIHPSALPRWRGAAPLNWTIMAGDATTDICIMEMVKALDAGDVYVRKPLAIAPDETAGTLHDKAAHMGAEALLEVINNWQDYKNNAVPQSDQRVTYAHKIKKADRCINFNQPADAVCAHIRGLSPFPGAVTMLEDGTQFKFLMAKTTQGQGQPGEVLAANKAQGLVVACAEGTVHITKLQKQGKPAMDVGAFLRGSPLPTGHFFK